MSAEQTKPQLEEFGILNFEAIKGSPEEGYPYLNRIIGGYLVSYDVRTQAIDAGVADGTLFVGEDLFDTDIHDPHSAMSRHEGCTVTVRYISKEDDGVQTQGAESTYSASKETVSFHKAGDTLQFSLVTKETSERYEILPDNSCRIIIKPYDGPETIETVSLSDIPDTIAGRLRYITLATHSAMNADYMNVSPDSAFEHVYPVSMAVAAQRTYAKLGLSRLPSIQSDFEVKNQEVQTAAAQAEGVIEQLDKEIVEAQQRLYALQEKRRALQTQVLNTEAELKYQLMQLEHTSGLYDMRVKADALENMLWLRHFRSHYGEPLGDLISQINAFVYRNIAHPLGNSNLRHTDTGLRIGFDSKVLTLKDDCVTFQTSAAGHNIHIVYLGDGTVDCYTFVDGNKQPLTGTVNNKGELELYGQRNGYQINLGVYPAQVPVPTKELRDALAGDITQIQQQKDMETWNRGPLQAFLAHKS